MVTETICDSRLGPALVPSTTLLGRGAAAQREATTSPREGPSTRYSKLQWYRLSSCNKVVLEEWLPKIRMMEENAQEVHLVIDTNYEDQGRPMGTRESHGLPYAGPRACQHLRAALGRREAGVFER